MYHESTRAKCLGETFYVQILVRCTFCFGSGASGLVMRDNKRGGELAMDSSCWPHGWQWWITNIVTHHMAMPTVGALATVFGTRGAVSGAYMAVCDSVSWHACSLLIFGLIMFLSGDNCWPHPINILALINTLVRLGWGCKCKLFNPPNDLTLTRSNILYFYLPINLILSQSVNLGFDWHFQPNQ